MFVTTDIRNLKLNEEITEDSLIYIYKDSNTQKYSIFYHDELKFPLNLEKLYRKNTKEKFRFSEIEDINVKLNFKENLIRIEYIKKEK